MKKLQSSFTNMVLVLTVVAIVSGGVLAWVDQVTSPQIKKINAENLAKGIYAVMGSDDIQVSRPIKKSEYVFCSIKDKFGKHVGTAAKVSTQGFGGTLDVLVGFDSCGTILGYTILSSEETPGLGAKANIWFQKGQKGNIVGKNPGQCNFSVSKEGGDIDAITASTITSRAFLGAIQNVYNELYASPRTKVNANVEQFSRSAE